MLIIHLSAPDSSCTTKLWPQNKPDFLTHTTVHLGFLGGSVVKNPPANGGDTGLIPGSGRFPGGGNGNPFQYSCQENPMDRGAWWATVHGVAKKVRQDGRNVAHMQACWLLAP